MSEVSPGPIDTFSVNFEEKEFDESRYSKLIAEKYKTSHTSICLKAADFLDELPNALSAIDSPTGDGINTYVVSKATKNAGITVALSGLGGDELFAGYPNFLKWYKTQNGLLSKFPSALKRPVAYALSNSANSKYQRAGDILSADIPDIAGIYPMFRQVMSQQTVSDFYKNGNECGPFPKLPAVETARNRPLSTTESVFNCRTARVHPKRAAQGHRPVQHGVRSRSPRAVFRLQIGRVRFADSRQY